ncbi:MAG: hypothetical protein L0154_13340 [Chloroflexi bacterium]|nr:hypothetical protein [Chloroflexota bacterium]
MTLTTQSSSELLEAAQSIAQWTAAVLQDAPLTKMQRTDFEAVQEYAQHFHRYASAELSIIQNFSQADPAEVQRVRHQLLNYLNIIVGFTQLVARDLPDNLLLYMVTVRHIQEAGEYLKQTVLAIR